MAKCRLSRCRNGFVQLRRGLVPLSPTTDLAFSRQTILKTVFQSEQKTDSGQLIHYLAVLTSLSSIIFLRSARTEARVPVMRGCQCKTGFSNSGVRASLSCSSIMQVQTVANVARLDGRTLSTRSLPCDDRRITRPSRAHDSKYISRHFGTELTVMLLFRLKRS